jgi:hypothetical protein
MYYYISLFILAIFLVFIIPYIWYRLFWTHISIRNFIIIWISDLILYCLTFLYAKDFIAPFIKFKCCQTNSTTFSVWCIILGIIIILKLLFLTGPIKQLFFYKIFTVFWSCAIIIILLISGWAWDLIFPCGFWISKCDIVPTATHDVINDWLDNYFRINN